jgi:hypothetical protein
LIDKPAIVDSRSEIRASFADSSDAWVLMMARRAEGVLRSPGLLEEDPEWVFFCLH